TNGLPLEPAVMAKERGHVTPLLRLGRGVVYLYPAGNSVASKSGTIPPFHYLCEGALPWYHTCFSTSSWSWGSSGSASCCMMPGQTSVPEGIRSHPNLCRRRASVPATRSRFLASPASPAVPPVRRPTSPYPSHPVARHPVSCLRGDGRAKWTPRGISARIRTVPIGAGSGSAISVPMDFLPFVKS